MPLGTLGINNEPTYYLHAETAGISVAGLPNSIVSGVRQYIEDVRLLGPGPVTVSFQAKGAPASGSTGSININLVQNFGTGGGQSDPVIYTNKITLSNTWSAYETTFTLANLLGKMTGASSSIGYTRLEFEIENDNVLGADRLTAIDLANVQIENDNNGTDYEKKTKSLEYQLCKRYYQIVNSVWSGYVGGGNGAVITGWEPDYTGPKWHNYYDGIELIIPLRSKPVVTAAEGFTCNSRFNGNFFTNNPFFEDVKLDWQERSGSDPYEDWKYVVVARQPITISGANASWDGGWIANYNLDSEYNGSDG